MNILILDDDISFLNFFKARIQPFFRSLFSELNIEVSSDVSIIDQKNYDIYFLDIDLIEYDGIELSKKIKVINPSGKIIFITAKDDLVYEAIAVAPFHFIRKSHLEKDLQRSYLLIADSYRQKKFYETRYNNEIIKILIDNIIYLETDDHLTTIYTNYKNYHIYKSMKQAMTELNCPEIVQINKNQCINLSHLVMQKKDDLFLDNEMSFKLSKRFKPSFEKDLNQYLEMENN